MFLSLSIDCGGAIVIVIVIVIIIIIIIIIIIKRQIIRCSNMARVTTRAPYNVRCSYSGNS